MPKKWKVKRTRVPTTDRKEQFPHLRRAPITEAVIDFRANMPAEFNFNAFAGLGNVLGAGYGSPKDINLMEFGVEQAPGKKPESRQIDHGRIGFRYDSADRKQIAQFRKDGFTFSRLAPYTRWEEVFGEASRLYRAYVEMCEPEEVTRTAVRYINRLVLPGEDIGDLSRFLTAPPNVPKDVPVHLTGFLTRVQIQDPETLIFGTLTQSIQPGSAESGKIPLILDLDIYESGAQSPNPDVILPRFEALRALKNRYFFASITEKTVKLCQ